MPRATDRSGAPQRKAEALLAERTRKETDRLNDRETDRRVQDEKVARLRGLRLAKEAADQSGAKPVAPGAGKKAATTA